MVSAGRLGGMRDKDLYATILGLQAPWQVSDVQLLPKAQEVHVFLSTSGGSQHRCPQCDRLCPGYDSRRRQWQHLDTCQFKTLLVAEVPRIECSEHGVVQIAVPWAEPGSGFTALMEALIIDWLQEASTAAVARLMRLTWDQIDGVMQRAVKRGLARRTPHVAREIGVDETSFQKRHEYVTVVCDLRNGHALHVADGRNREALDSFFQGLAPSQLSAIESVAMDMCPAYIRSTLHHVPGAVDKIAFDRFHVAQHLGRAVNDVRKQEHRRLLDVSGESVLTRTRYLWLENPENMTRDRRARFNELRDSDLQVAKAWAIKENARHLWLYSTRTWALKAWKAWLGWALRCKLQPMRRAALTIKEHLWGIINATVLRVTNAASESLNSKIQWLKKNACGFRNRDRFRNAIYFHCGGLQLYPAQLLTHTSS